MTMSCDDAGMSGARRFEVFTGAGTRRRWPAEIRASIIAESYSGSETVSAVARRHGLAPSQLFTWRRELRRKLEADSGPVFVPAVVEQPAAPDPHRQQASASSMTAAVELQLDGMAVRIAHTASAEMVAAVIGSLRAAR